VATKKSYWLVKQEPEDYSFAELQKDKTTAWTGVRNFQARNFLRAMREGDLVLFYHSGTGKEVTGIAQVNKEAEPDPTATEGDWCCVGIAAKKPLKVPVPLPVLKSDPILKSMLLVRQSRLSVSPVSREQFARILELGDTRL
jgi:predicted RNA-binding protein with PUA-like domain